jgi:uncharacterized protein (DUF2236 family)
MSPTDLQTDKLESLVYGAGLMAGGANVIMQLARPGVGYGVVESKVESGRQFDHPIKRTRTTLTYLAVATMGTDEDKRVYREAVNVSHRQVRSTEDSPVKYHAMDPTLQLWVAACLYRGFEDVYASFGGKLDPDTAEQIYRGAHTLGTTLQVRESMWPADRNAFQKYWDSEMTKVSIDDAVREHLTTLIKFTYLPRVYSALLGPFNVFVTTGFLPPEFRAEMRLPWNERKQRRFDRMMRTIGTIVRHQPKVLREFPFNYYLRDMRKRQRTGRPLV